MTKEELEKKVADLTAEMVELKKANEELSVRCEEQSKQIESTETRNVALEKENDDLKAANSRMEETLKSLRPQEEKPALTITHKKKDYEVKVSSIFRPDGSVFNFATELEKANTSAVAEVVEEILAIEGQGILKLITD